MGQAVFVMGPAGSGKTTFCKKLYEHGIAIHRSLHLINLDPAQIQENTVYSVDLRDFVTVEDIMENYDFGPNGGLIVALEELYDNIDELDLESLSSDFLIVDCPGQIELFTHSDTFKNIVEHFKKYFTCCIVYLIEAQFVSDPTKFISGCFVALLSMCRFSLPHLNIISKLDQLEISREILEEFCQLSESIKDHIQKKKGEYNQLCLKMYDFIVENNLVSFLELNYDDENTFDTILYSIDEAVQYFDDAEPKDHSYN
ncbi:hypothetical protein LUQ84_001932 [Hamiltosporidium tvaerminnensis]|nr:hypothetical protein LUQ84_001932 [Hamiltosporidium tvaerminnensis]